MLALRVWPKILTGCLAAVPMAAFGFMLVSMVVQSWPASDNLGVKLLGTAFAGPSASLPEPLYGLITPLWGTVQIALLTLLFAIPSALAIAIVLEEMPLGPITRVLSPALGLMSGIPPIVYALIAFVLMENWMRPKFSGSDLDYPIAAAIQNSPIYIAKALPNALPNSQFLGAILLALLVIPLMAPLLADALHGVPVELRLASYALGAGRWSTLTRVVIPAALPGLISAITLGALKAIGEVTIPYFVVAYGALDIFRLPDPVWDVFTRTQPLSSAGAVLLRGFNNEGMGAGPTVDGLPMAVAYTMGLLLVLLAFVLMGLTALAQRRLGAGVRR